MTSRPPITCHVLDTTRGRPAVGVHVTLTHVVEASTSTPTSTPTSGPSPSSFVARTDRDGRVGCWEERDEESVGEGEDGSGVVGRARGERKKEEEEEGSTDPVRRIWEGFRAGEEEMVWELRFESGEYFSREVGGGGGGGGGEEQGGCFFPQVIVRFVVRPGQRSEHFHVPVLLGPFGYTTYRGS